MPAFVGVIFQVFWIASPIWSNFFGSSFFGFWCAKVQSNLVSLGWQKNHTHDQFGGGLGGGWVVSEGGRRPPNGSGHCKSIHLHPSPLRWLFSNLSLLNPFWLIIGRDKQRVWVGRTSGLFQEFVFVPVDDGYQLFPFAPNKLLAYLLRFWWLLSIFYSWLSLSTVFKQMVESAGLHLPILIFVYLHFQLFFYD